MKYLHVYVWNTFFVYEYSIWKNAKVSELARFLIYLGNTVMQLYFLIPSKDKKVTLGFFFSKQNPLSSFNQLLSQTGEKEKRRDQSRKTAFKACKNGGTHAYVKSLDLPNT